MVWDEWLPLLQDKHLKKLEKWDKSETQRLKRLKKAQDKNEAPKEKDMEPIPKPEYIGKMLPDDDDIFMQLSASLKILLARSIIVEDLPRAKQLLQDYLLRFQKVSLLLYCRYQLCTDSIDPRIILIASNPIFIGLLIYSTRY